MTWSILVRDGDLLGGAVATKFFAVGALCLHVEGGVGAIATQALINPMLAWHGMPRLRAADDPAVLVPLLMAGDDGRAVRQLHMIDAAGRIGQHTGAECIGWCGHLTGAAGGAQITVAGNMLAGTEVLDRTMEAYASTSGPMAIRLLAALAAGEAAGGDKRGRQSAALKIASRDPYPDLDLRIDDHPDPLAELRRLYAVSQEHFAIFRRFLAGRDSPCGTYDRAVIMAAVEQGTPSG